MNTAFRVLLTFNATSLLVIIFAVQKGTHSDISLVVSLASIG